MTYAMHAHDLDQLQNQGYCLLKDLLAPDVLAEVTAVLERNFAQDQWGRNEFEGRRTERLYALLAKFPIVAKLVEHPAILELLKRHLAPSAILAACQATRIHPGETAQALHADDDLAGVARPRPPWSLSVMWALSPYTPENGSTLLVPGSHLWPDGREPQEHEIVSLSFDPGSALVWLGGVYHGGGANTSAQARTGVSIIYFQPWLRQVENMVLAVPPDRAAQYSETVQRLLGYSVAEPTFFGHVDGRDPIKLIKEAIT
ncbi:phytanoyl-CoA dioxygenase family protein [Mycobacterium sp.]|uniref:phytanoyl-CoA dioxygenase family protein n=1 Tax=Mycobacterium sp. TaxID=1785 RepID=UPI003BA88AAA